MRVSPEALAFQVLKESGRYVELTEYKQAEIDRALSTVWFWLLSDEDRQLVEQDDPIVQLVHTVEDGEFDLVEES